MERQALLCPLFFIQYRHGLSARSDISVRIATSSGLDPGIKRSKRGANHPPQSSAEVEEKVEIYIYSPSGPSLPVLERNSHGLSGVFFYI
jgi:hypothetical protein